MFRELFHLFLKCSPENPDKWRKHGEVLIGTNTNSGGDPWKCGMKCLRCNLELIFDPIGMKSEYKRPVDREKEPQHLRHWDK